MLAATGTTARESGPGVAGTLPPQAPVVRPLEADSFPAWESLVAAHRASGFAQTLAWAAFKEREGYRTWPLGFYRGQELLGGAILHAYPTRATGHAILHAPHGPVLPWAEPALAREGLRQIIAAARPIAAAIGALALRIEPQLPTPRPALLREFARAPMDFFPAETLYLDLTQDEATLLAAMKPKGRYNIGLAARKGVRVTRSTSLQDLRRFYRLFQQTARRNEFFAESYGFFINLCAALAAAGMVRFYFASHPDFAADDDPGDLAAAIVVRCGARTTYLYGASAEVGRNLMAPYALQWTMIADARAEGATEYDFYGYEPHGVTDHLYAGFSRFKRQFGGVPVRLLGAHDYIFYDTLATALTTALQQLDQTGNGLTQGR